MNAVFLIGNGFDLNLGLKTSYTDFIEAYSKIGAHHQSHSVCDFINFIKAQKELGDPNWSDIEIQMGQFTTSFIGDDYEERAKLFHEDLVLALSEYIKTQCNQISQSQELKDTFCNYLMYPEMNGNLLQNELRYFSDIVRKRWDATTRWDLKIISFNYTNTIESLVSVNADQPIGTFYQSSNRGKTFLTAIEHVHGFVDNRLIVGVNDASQIANEQLRKTSAMDWYVKARGNMMTGQMHADRCRQYISNAHLICAFGFSFGSTDQQWWEYIVRRMLADSNVRLILYIYAPNVSFNSLQFARMNEYKQKQKDYFIKQSGVVLREELRESLKNRIFIALNSKMFNLGDSVIRKEMPYDVQIAKVG